MKYKLLNILDFKEIAASYNGFCLEDEYIGLDQLMKWKCSNNHVFISRASDVRYSKSWCRECSNIKNSNIIRSKFYKKIESNAEKHNGKCLSDEYINKDHKMQMKCHIGHTWWARPHDLLRGHWCNQCDLSRKLTIEDCQETAKSKNGICLSSIYKNSKQKLLWQCAYGHIWKATAAMVRHRTWCPYCKNKTEGLCREIFEEIFNEKFLKTKPKWLIGVKGWGLELDGFCEKLNMAFEYNGEQHYNKIDFFDGGQRIETLQANDKIKKELCKKNNVKLIVVKFIKNPTKELLKEKILKELM